MVVAVAVLPSRHRDGLSEGMEAGWVRGVLERMMRSRVRRRRRRWKCVNIMAMRAAMVRTEVTTMVRSVFAADVRGVRMEGIV